jgi:2,3-bisphosphoglycerate-dependent phosphoglycerate mutase
MTNTIRNIVLLRHGESVWNKENLFTGWTDVNLSEQGIREAVDAARILKKGGYSFDIEGHGWTLSPLLG